MTDVNEILARLAEARTGYKAFVEAVDADLARERQARLAVRQGDIMHMIAEAYTAGASKRAIMGAYDTKDFKTIQRILDSMTEEIALMQAEEAAVEVAATTDWFELNDDDTVQIEGDVYNLFALEADEYMLDGPGGYDSYILFEKEPDTKLKALWKAVHERNNS